VNTAEWTLPPSAKGPQVGQIIAGRYRLALFKGGDDVAEVWHAVEDATGQVVTIEILRDPDDADLRKQFLEQAHRMAKIERPSVMKVAAIHDDPTGAFVVFEHLIPLSIELPDLEPLAPAAAAPTVALAPSEPVAPASAKPEAVVPPEPEWVVPSENAAVAAGENGADAKSEPLKNEPSRNEPLKDAASDETAVITRPSRPETRQVARSLALAKSDASALMASAMRLAERAPIVLRGLRLDTLVVRARAIVPKRLDSSRVKTAAARAAAAAGPLLVRARPWLVRARHNQIVMAVAVAALVLAVFIASPLDDAIASALRPKPTAAPTAEPTAPLVRAPFEVPPLSAYGASFESQAPYPTAAPNAPVEWVVALRNTGSAGWYRGIDGAQMALALNDGTGVAVQSTQYVAPGQVGWFVVHLRARSEPGAYTVPLNLRVDGRGPLPDLGIHLVVTVTRSR
jgi:hypothetical protein